jgi:hypothetical protein
MAMNFMNWLQSGRGTGSKAVLLTLCASLVWLGVQAAEAIAVRPDSPQNYTVQQGDTLWGIAARFLEQPWLWPQVWQINPQIQNPDLIYPGDTISLSYQDGQPVLTLNSDGQSVPVTGGSTAVVSAPNTTPVAGIRTERRSPEVRRESLLSPIPAIPLDKIDAFLSKTTVVDADTYKNAPYLLGERDGRTLYGTGDEVLARGNWQSNLVTYDIVRQGREFIDPDTRDVLGVESLLIGTATITSYNGDKAIMKVNSAELEARIGDRLIAREALAIDPSYLPQPPPFKVDAAIVNIGGGHDIGGQYDTLVLNQGSGIGLQPGHVLVVRKPDVIIDDRVGKRGFMQGVRRVLGLATGDRQIEFPGENAGNVLIYRVYEHASLALVLDSSQSISIKDRAITP